MRKFLAFALLIVATFLVQTTLMHILPVSSVTPNLLLVLTVSIAFMRGRHAGLLVGFFGGLLADLFYGGGLFGLHALIFTYIGYLCGIPAKKFFDTEIKMPLLLVAASDLVYGLVLYAVEAVLHRGLRFPLYFTRTILPEVVATSLLTILLYRLFHFVNARVTAREMEVRSSPWLRR